MAPIPHSPRRSLSLTLLLALLLPLLAACGSGPGGSGPAVGGGSSEQESALSSAPRPAATSAAAAAEPTMAAMAPAEGAPVTGDSAEGSVGAAPPLPLPTMAATPQADAEARPQGQQTPLKAGERDDNDQFAEYLDYLARYQGPPARQLDVNERYIITVRDQNQQPVLDARVRIYDGQQQIFEGRTYAGGETIFLPAALGVSANATQLRVVAEQGNGQGEASLTRTGQPGTLEVAIAAPAAEMALRLDMLFLLDATGSMGDEIARIQNTIVSIAERIDGFTPRPEVRFGLVAYKDRGDDYVTRVYDFTTDVEAFRRVLLSVQANGGGDTPESLNEALHAALHEVTWADNAVRLAFLVADAPPHLDYEQDYDYLAEAQQAVTRGVKIYPIAASNSDEQAEYVFRQLAQQTLASFIFLTYQPGAASGAPGESTPLEAGDSPQGFTVERLDDLVVQIVQRELAAAIGAV